MTQRARPASSLFLLPKPVFLAAWRDDRGNHHAGSSSYRLRVGENGFSQLRRQITGRQQVYGNAKQVLQLGLKGAKIEQGRPRQRVDQDVEIAPFHIGAMRC
jgi:hypothetical protein